MTGWLTALGPAGTALSLLLLGHILADFVFQPEEMATSKHQARPLLTHVGIVTVVHAVTLLPLLTTITAILVVVVGIIHLFIDGVSAQLRHRGAMSDLSVFVGDLIAHLLVVLVAWSVVDSATWTSAPVLTALGGANLVPWAEMTTGAVYLSAFVFAHKGGNVLVRGVLPADGPETEGDDLEMGSRIGTLERWVILLLGLGGVWEAVALVVAAKSIARFQELKEQPFAEYFLVGTLSSVLIAIGLVVLVSVLV